MDDGPDSVSGPSVMHEASTCGQHLGIQGRQKLSRPIGLIILGGTSQKIGKSTNLGSWKSRRILKKPTKDDMLC